MIGNVSVLIKWLGPVALVTWLFGCSAGSGDGPGDAGNQEDLPPVAKAVVINYAGSDAAGNTAATVRSGAEVLVSGKDSDDPDDSLVSFVWSVDDDGGTGLSDADLIVRNRATVSFTAPNIDAESTIRLELTVTSADGATASATATVTIVGPPDSNEFLSYPGRRNQFGIVATTVDSKSPGDLVPAANFSITVAKQLKYRPRRDSSSSPVLNNCDSPPPVWTEQLAAAEVVRFDGAWESDAGTVGLGNDDATTRDAVRDAPQNPRYFVGIPSINADDVNRLYTDAVGSQAALQLKPSDIDDSQLDVIVTLTPGTSAPPDLAIVLLAEDRSTVLGSAKNAGDGAPVVITVDAEALRVGDHENRRSAQSYYCAIDPNGEKLTLAQWLVANGFDPEDRDLGADPVELPADSPHAVYLNNFDLGFGRDMYMKRTATGCVDPGEVQYNVSGVVINYPSLEAAAKRTGAVLAVAMENALKDPNGGNCDPSNRIATFYAYAPDDDGDADNNLEIDTGDTGRQLPSYRRVLSANFDGRGEKYVPGSCTVCHGGRPATGFGDSPYPENGGVGATFLPWDLESFLYTADSVRADPSFSSSPEDAALREQYSRQNQESTYKRFNEIALATYPDPDLHPDPADPDADSPFEGYRVPRDLIQGWYGGDSLPADNQTSHLPAGWDLDSSDPFFNHASTLYGQVIAQNCRACHVQQVGPANTSRALQFAGWNDFLQFLDGENSQILQEIFLQHTMPGSRLTADRFWLPFGSNSVSAAQTMWDTLQFVTGADSSPLELPGRPVVNQDPPGNNVLGFGCESLDPATEDADAECPLGAWLAIDPSPIYFVRAGQLTWSAERITGGTIDNKCGTPIPGPLGAALAGRNADQLGLRLDLPGTYCVSVAAASDVASPLKRWAIRVPDLSPVFQPSPFTLTPIVGNAVTFAVDNSPTGVLTALGDGSTADHTVVSIDGSAVTCPTQSAVGVTNGEVSCARDASGTALLTFDPTGTNASQDGEFTIQVADLNGSLAQDDAQDELRIVVDYQPSLVARSEFFTLGVNESDSPIAEALNVISPSHINVTPFSGGNGWRVRATSSPSRTSLTPSYVPEPYRSATGSLVEALGAPVADLTFNKPSRVSTVGVSGGGATVYRGNASQDQITFSFDMLRYSNNVLVETVPGFTAEIGLQTQSLFGPVNSILETCASACHNATTNSGEFNYVTGRHGELFESEGGAPGNPLRIRLGSPSVSRLLTFPVTGTLHPAANVLTPQERADILAWINRGAFEQ